MRPLPVSRRRFVQGLATATLATGLTGKVSASVSGRIRRQAKNIIFLVSDGMNHGTLMLAERYLQETKGASQHWVQLLRSKRPGIHRALLDTASANSVVPDSAAAGSAWGCGARVPNRSLNITVDGTHLEPILVTAKRSGLRTGLVTTTRITDATPASFAANVSHRNQEDAIAQQYLEREVDLLVGGGDRHFAPVSRADGADLWAEFRQKGYDVVRSRSEWESRGASPGKRLALFSEGHLPFEIDRLHQPELRSQIPSLAALTRASLHSLAASGTGFFLQVEGARIDHAAHANDSGGVIHDQLAFDAAVGEALAFAGERDDTLVIITTDHGTGGCQINGGGSGYVETNQRFRNLFGAKETYEHLLSRLPTEITADQLDSSLQAALGLDLPRELIETVLVAVNHDRTRGFYDGSWPLGGGLRPYLLETTGVGWSSHHHTGEPVEWTAFGPSSELLQGLHDNTEVHALLLEAIGGRG